MWPLAAFGFAASLCINVAAIIGWKLADIVGLCLWTAGTFLVLPAGPIESRYRKSSSGKSALKPWARRIANGLTIYAIVSFVIAIALTPEHAGITPTGLLVFSAFWMLFYFNAFARLYWETPRCLTCIRNVGT